MAVLYRKYRPQKLSEIVGQDEITSSLLKQLESGKISHAYLFSGPRGTGKTSTARILAKALNCKNAKEGRFAEPCGKCESCLAITEGRYLDLIEIDAASNRGIDEIRELREKIGLSPTEGKYKVYIIDEVHMLTNEAFNALLKTLEEPPAHAFFILATTEPQKIPATITSRAQRFNFQRPTLTKIEERLTQICKQEGLKLSKEALHEIAASADGAFRDAEVLLDQVAAVDPEATTEKVREIIGKAEFKTELLDYLLAGKTKEALEWLDTSVQNGANIRLLLESYLETFRNLLLLKQGVGPDLLEVREEHLPKLADYSKKLTSEKLVKWVNLFTTALVDLRTASIPQLPAEMAIIEACGYPTEKSEESQPVEKEDPVVEEKTIEPTPVVEVKTEENKNLAPVHRTSDMKKILAAWETILAELKPKNNSLEIFLKKASPKEIEDGILTIEFGYAFHKDRFEEPKNRAILEAILAEVLGEPVKIKGIVGTPPPRPVQKDAPKEEVDPVEVFGKLD